MGGMEGWLRVTAGHCRRHVAIWKRKTDRKVALGLDSRGHSGTKNAAEICGALYFRSVIFLYPKLSRVKMRSSTNVSF